MNLTLKVWRQKNEKTKGSLENYNLKDVSPDSSFLEMMDLLNEKLITDGEEPVAFDHDCREGICGMCSMYINGEAHGPGKLITTCQLHMRSFKDGETIYIEPFRAKAFPVIKDLTVDRLHSTEYNKLEDIFLSIHQERHMVRKCRFITVEYCRYL
jgi:succinate dehydrogenase / fumarate reductase iron-sulfur subunit